jgi:acetyl esterase
MAETLADLATASGPGGGRPRQRLSLMGYALHAGLSALALATRLSPLGLRHRRAVEVLRDIPYGASASPAHRLDVYRPRGAPGPRPMVLYVHGGGFTVLSKESHWLMASSFAEQGFWVANINYRLAPAAPYPCALEDVATAWLWLQEHAPRLGGDPARLILAGESAGANLITALTLACCHPLPAPWAGPVHARGAVPGAVLAACGILDVSTPERFRAANPHLNPWAERRIREVCRAYLGGLDAAAAEAALASPLRWLEGPTLTARSLPPFLITVGDRDPIVNDSRRLHAALQRRGVPSRYLEYSGGHAFHALPWRAAAQACWRDTFAFLDGK